MKRADVCGQNTMNDTDLLHSLANSASAVIAAAAGPPVSTGAVATKDGHRRELDGCATVDFSDPSIGTLGLCLSRGLASRVAAGGPPGREAVSAAASDLLAKIVSDLARRLSGSRYGYTPGSVRPLDDREDDFTVLTQFPCLRIALDASGEPVVLLLSMLDAEGSVVGEGGLGQAAASQLPDSGAAARDTGDGETLAIDPDMEGIVDGFVVETEELMEKLDQDLVGLDKSPGDKDLVNSVFRAFHTLKGNSLALGFMSLNTAVHRTEDVIRKVRDGELAVSPAMMDVVFGAVDVIRGLLDDVRQRRGSTTDLEPMIARLKAVLDGGGEAGPKKLEIDDDMQEIVNGFVVESEELLQKLDQDLVSLEEAPEDADRVASVFRAFHTLKGNSRALGFGTLEELVHRTEEVIRNVRDGKAKVRPEMMDVVLRSADLVRVLLDDIKNRTVSTADLSSIKTELRLVFEGKYGEPADLKAKAPAAAARVSSSAQKAAARTIRVDLGKLDALFRVTGELVLNKNRLLNLVQQVEQGATVTDLGEVLNEIAAQTSIMVSDLQSSVMTTRMQPVGKVFSKYPRVVRDLARDLAKEIDLVVTGEDTELDNTIIEEIGDPLIHLVRNSCDHGIETPEDRLRKGKPARGTVELKAYHEGSSVVIEIRDDGKGMDADVLRAKAIEKGLATAEQAAAMSKAEVLNLIFLPGFSTASAVTAVSGRGVGMDVVKTNISRLNGIIELDSEKDRGSTVKVRLPLTMAVLTALEVETGHERYLIPQECIVEIVRVPRARYGEVVRDDEFNFRGEYWNPLIDLGKTLGAQSNGRATADQVYVVVVGSAEERTGLLVDNVLQQHEVVIKPLSRYLEKFSPPHISGATIMGDGGVEIILNHNYFLALGHEARRRGQNGADSAN